MWVASRRRQGAETGEVSESMSNGSRFNEWLRIRLKARKMSQRQLARRSGINHSTISRLVRGERSPTLATATKLANVFGADGGAGAPTHGMAQDNATSPAARVERALRADSVLGQAEVREVMRLYLSLRKGGEGLSPLQATRLSATSARR